MHVAQILEPPDDEWLEQYQRHFLRETALVKFQFRADNDHRAAGVVHAFAEQVLAETPALALQHVTQRLERTVAGTRHGATMTTVVKQRIDRFLQHAFLVPDDDLRGLERQKVLQPVVAVDDAAVEIVQVGRGETAALKRNQGAQIRRNHRQHRQHHPLGPTLGLEEALINLDALGQFLANLLAARLGHGELQAFNTLIEVDGGQGVVNPLGTDLGHKRFRPVGFLGIAILHFREELVFFQRRFAGIDHEIILVVNNPLKVAGGDIHHQPDAGGHALEKPDMGHRHRQLDVAHALAPDARLGHFHAAAVADHAAMLDPLVLAAGTFPVLDRAKNPLAKKPALLWLECAVVDGLRVLDLTLGPRPDGLRGSHSDGDMIHMVDLVEPEQLS